MNDNIATVVFREDECSSRASGTWQYDYGQILRIQGLDLPKVVEIHFSLEETGGTSVTRIGTTKDSVTDVPIPDSMLENHESDQNYKIYAFIYLSENNSGNTERKITIPVKARPRPEIPGTPEEPELFRKAVEIVSEAAGRAEKAQEQAEASKQAAAQSEQNINNTVTAFDNHVEKKIAGFDSRVFEAVEQSKEEINTTKQQAINTITNQQDAAVNIVKTEGEKIITRVGNDAKTVADDRATVEEATQTVLNNAQEVAQNTQTVASNTEKAAASAEGAKTSADNAAQSAKSVEDASKQIEQNKKDVDSLKEDLGELGNKTLHEEYADLLHGKEPKENWYIDASNGTGRTLAQFFSYIDIDVSEYIGKKLYPYTSHKNTNVYHSSRSVVFYDESGTFISGTGVSSGNPINGIEVPEKSKTVSVCFNYDSDDNQPIKPQVYYLSINRENKNKLMLKKDVLIDYEQIQNKPIIPTKMSELENDIVIDNVNDVQTIRKPTISFIFDDGLPSTSDLVSLFDSYGWKCGFAILANSDLPNIKDNFLSYQSKGYEILSHSTDGVAMQDDSLTIDDVETKMKKSKEILINNGFNITGWVTPSTWLNNKYFDNLCKYYEYGFGHLDTNQVVNHHVFWGNDIRQLERWSLQSKTLEQTKAEIDSTINECGYLCFYAHEYPSTENDNFTIENMKIIMDYIKKYIDNGKVQVLIPRCAINDYYTVRHSDLLDLYKKNN